LSEWPDREVPGNELIDVMIEYTDFYLKSKVHNTLVHCSAGIGRTGTFISIAALYWRMVSGSDLFNIP
jgi:protein tyrosine phosphatase